MFKVVIYLTPEFLKKSQSSKSYGEPWKVLVVDDEPDIHAVTSVIAKDIIFEGRPVKIYSAYSSTEAIEILRNVPDIAIAIIDVVMESDDSGLKLVKFIREELSNNQIRLVIRTGQPGYAPPRDIILKYDINDYREKSELSSNGLFTMIVAKLREYKYIVMLDTQKKLLERLNFYTTMLSGKVSETEHIELITEVADNVSLLLNNNFSLSYEVISNGDIEKNNNPNNHFVWDNDRALTLRFKNKMNEYTKVNIEFSKAFDEFYKSLLESFFERFALSMENHLLTRDLVETLYKIVYVISEVTETRSSETGEHVRRIGKLAKLLANFFGYDDDFANMFEIAAMLHDVGKIGIPDGILNKPARLSEEEFEIMKQHTVIGYRILSTVDHPIFQLASSVALNHHENWNGTGYPNGLRGEEIPFEARIVSLIDTFDALLSDRVYRPAWKEEDVLKYIKENTGIKFDPKISKMFFDIYEEIRKIYFG